MAIPYKPAKLLVYKIPATIIKAGTAVNPMIKITNIVALLLLAVIAH